ncbi:hypothetical protein HQ529_02295 [Candidatus Woesearchaeota archaeon]|nr:hypothetical protein [Candidatus Woesearchaeota archaeon]
MDNNLKMSAVVRAGKDNMPLWLAYLSIAAAYVGTSAQGIPRGYYFDKYKPLLNASPEKYAYLPVIAPILYELDNNSKYVNDIVIVGKKEKLEPALERIIDSIEKPIQIIESDGKMHENMIKGGEAAEIPGHKIYVDADTPLVLGEEIDKSVEQCVRFEDGKPVFDHTHYQFFISEETLHNGLPSLERVYLRLIPDGRLKTDRDKRFENENGAYGFKETNLIILDEKKGGIKGLSDIYSIRIGVNPVTWFKTAGLLIEKGMAGYGYALAKDLFIHKTGTTSQMEEFLSKFAGMDIHIVESPFARFSFDIDERGDMGILLKEKEYVNRAHKMLNKLYGAKVIERLDL